MGRQSGVLLDADKRSKGLVSGCSWVAPCTSAERNIMNYNNIIIVLISHACQCTCVAHIKVSFKNVFTS